MVTFKITNSRWRFCNGGCINYMRLPARIHNIEQVVREIKWQYILASFFLTNLTLILSTFRFGSLIRNFGVEDSWRSMHRTNLYSCCIHSCITSCPTNHRENKLWLPVGSYSVPRSP